MNTFWFALSAVAFGAVIGLAIGWAVYAWQMRQERLKHPAGLAPLLRNKLKSADYQDYYDHSDLPQSLRKQGF